MPIAKEALINSTYACKLRKSLLIGFTMRSSE